MRETMGVDPETGTSLVSPCPTFSPPSPSPPPPPPFHPPAVGEYK
jgi:hypothetical protein